MYIKPINWKLNFRSFSVKWKLFKNKINILTTIVKASRYLMLNCSKKGVFASFLLKILFLADMLNWSPSLRKIYNKSCRFFFRYRGSPNVLFQAPKSVNCLSWTDLNCDFVIARSFFLQHFSYHAQNLDYQEPASPIILMMWPHVTTSTSCWHVDMSTLVRAYTRCNWLLSFGCGDLNSR